MIVPAPDGTTTVPTERGTRPIDPIVDAGQQILITSHGLVPQHIFSLVTEKVTWTNLSGTVQNIVFDYVPVRSPAIPPGAQYVWTPSTAIEIAYRTTSGMKGVLTLQEPGNY